MKRLAVALLFCFGSYLAAQTGSPRFAAVQGGGFDNVNTYNLNVQFAVPIVSVPARGLPFAPNLVYNSLIWQKNGAAWSPVVDKNGTPTWGWLRQRPTGNATFKYQRFRCVANDQTNQWSYRYYQFKYTEPDGTVHPFGLDFMLPEQPDIYPECGDANPTTTGYATDDTGFYIDATHPNPFNGAGVNVAAPSGADIDVGGTLNDSNGNYISYSVVSPSETDWTDSSGRLSLKIINNTSTSPYTTQYKFQAADDSWQTVTMTMSAKSVKSPFTACSGTSQYQASNVQLPDSITLPNSKTYGIQYEIVGGYVTGRISKIILPTGGYIQYSYSGVNCADGTPMSLTRTVNDGTTSVSWTYTRSQVISIWQTKVTPPTLPYDSASNETMYTFNTQGMPTTVETYQGTVAAGTLLQKIETGYDAYGYLPSLVTTTLGSKKKKTSYGFDQYGNVTTVAEFDWGSTSPTRTSTMTYLGTSSYIDRQILNRVSKIEVRDGDTSGTLRSVTEVFYDESDKVNQSCPPGVPNHNDVLYGCTFTLRGNPTTIKQYADVSGGTGTSPVTTTLTYDFFGNVLTKSIDGALQSTSAYSNATNYSQPGSVVAGPTGNSLTTLFTYKANGLLASSTDPNSGKSEYGYDAMNRIKSIKRPDGNSVTTTYDDTLHTVSVTTPFDGLNTLTRTSTADGLGRVILVETPTAKSSTVYDPLGRAYQASNPYTTSPSYWTTTKFDALGRTLSVTAPNNLVTAAYTYGDNTVTIIDGAGKQRKQEFDGLGRLVKVSEPDVSNQNALNQDTTYAYSALDSILTVTQGVQTRTFVYDGLNRVTSVHTPEAGTVTYSYAGCSANPSNVCSRTDARGVVTSYSYDTLNRPHQVSYDVGTTGVPATPTVTYSYGTSTQDFNNGRLTQVSDGSHTDVFTYDLIGNALSVAKTLSGVTYTTAYQYNYAGQPTRITYPSQMYLAYAYNTAGQLQSITDNNGKQYATGLSYNLAGQLTGYQMGLSGGTVTASMGYSSDLFQLSTLGYSTSLKTLLSLSYGYSLNNGNNGQITTITDNVESGLSATYGYDALNRLTSFSTTGSVNYPAQAMGWTYDRYGNRLTQTTNGNTQTLSPSTTTNQLGLTYDANGNLANDGTYQFVWDAENRMVNYAGGSVTNEYDANSLRVKRTQGASSVIYVFAGTVPIAEYAPGAAATSPSREYVYLGSQLLAKKESGAYTFYERDHLSIRGILADANPNSPTEYGHRPFGESWYGSGNKWSFTSYERDSGVTDDFAMFRRYQYNYGRFSSPDPVLGSAGNPQSWNRYSYVRNMPVILNDPSGQTAESYSWVGDRSCTSVDWSMYWLCQRFETGGGGGFGSAFSEIMGTAYVSYVTGVDEIVYSHFLAYWESRTINQSKSSQILLAGLVGSFVERNKPSAERKKQFEECKARAKGIYNAQVRAANWEMLSGGVMTVAEVALGGYLLTEAAGIELVDVVHLSPVFAPAPALYEDGMIRKMFAQQDYDRSLADCNFMAGYPE